MAKTIIYTGSLGPDTIRVGGVTMTKNEPVTVDNDTLAAAILKKPGFVTADKAADLKSVISDQKSRGTRGKE